MSKVPTVVTSLWSLIPHMHVPPQKVCPFSAQKSLSYPASLSGLQQHVRQEFLEPRSYFPAHRGTNLSSLSPRELLTGLTTHFFCNTTWKSLLQSISCANNTSIGSLSQSSTIRYDSKLLPCSNSQYPR
jgi:hypothetical protein